MASLLEVAGGGLEGKKAASSPRSKAIMEKKKREQKEKERFHKLQDSERENRRKQQMDVLPSYRQGSSRRRVEARSRKGIMEIVDDLAREPIIELFARTENKDEDGSEWMAFVTRNDCFLEEED